MADTARPDLVHVIADHTPGPHRTDSDDLVTGTVHVFHRCDYCCGSQS